MITPHMDDGSPELKWRNAVALDPLKRYGDWSYSDALVSPAAQVGRERGRGLCAWCRWRGAAAAERAPGAAAVLHWSDAGAASWYDFAVAIGERGVAAGLLEQAARVQPIPTSAYPTPAARPPYSLLDCSASRAALGLEPTHWRAALVQVLAQLANVRANPGTRA
jgi:hypothetical protein